MKQDRDKSETGKGLFLGTPEKLCRNPIGSVRLAPKAIHGDPYARKVVAGTE